MLIIIRTVWHIHVPCVPDYPSFWHVSKYNTPTLIFPCRRGQGSWGIVRRILREEGFLGLFRGQTSTWVREVPGYFFFFGGYHASKKLLIPDQENSESSKYRQDSWWSTQAESVYVCIWLALVVLIVVDISCWISS